MSATQKPTLSKPYVLPRTEAVYDIWFPSSREAPGRDRAKLIGAQTDGRLAQVHLVEPRGAAPPAHFHHDADETIYVIDGRVSVFLGEEQVEADRGAFLFVPKGAVHTWLVHSEHAELFLSLAPAGLEGFFAEVGFAVTPGVPTPRALDVDLQDMNQRAEADGVEFVGPPPTLDD
jgi:quercetin dioxygenase-like cupin family protein